MTTTRVPPTSPAARRAALVAAATLPWPLSEAERRAVELLSQAGLLPTVPTLPRREAG